MMDSEIKIETGKLIKFLEADKNITVTSDERINNNQNVSFINLKTSALGGRTYIESVISGKINPEDYETRVMHCQRENQYQVSLIRKSTLVF